MATDVKNGAGGDTGNAQNGQILIKTGIKHRQTLQPNGYSEFTIAGFDTSPPGMNLTNMSQYPRYYQGDTNN